MFIDTAIIRSRAETEGRSGILSPRKYVAAGGRMAETGQGGNVVFAVDDGINTLSIFVTASFLPKTVNPAGANAVSASREEILSYLFSRDAGL